MGRRQLAGGVQARHTSSSPTVRRRSLVAIRMPVHPHGERHVGVDLARGSDLRERVFDRRLVVNGLDGLTCWASEHPQGEGANKGSRGRHGWRASYSCIELFRTVRIGRGINEYSILQRP